MGYEPDFFNFQSVEKRYFRYLCRSPPYHHKTKDYTVSTMYMLIAGAYGLVNSSIGVILIMAYAMFNQVSLWF